MAYVTASVTATFKRPEGNLKLATELGKLIGDKFIKTSDFDYGETATIRVYAPPNAELVVAESTANVSPQRNGQGTKEIKEYLMFSKFAESLEEDDDEESRETVYNEASLSKGVSGGITTAWLNGKNLGAAVLQSDNITVRAEKYGAGSLKVEYLANYFIFTLASPSEPAGDEANKGVQVGVFFVFKPGV